MDEIQTLVTNPVKAQSLLLKKKSEYSSLQLGEEKIQLEEQYDALIIKNENTIDQFEKKLIDQKTYQDRNLAFNYNLYKINYEMQKLECMIEKNNLYNKRVKKANNFLISFSKKQNENIPDSQKEKEIKSLIDQVNKELREIIYEEAISYLDKQIRILEADIKRNNALKRTGDLVDGVCYDDSEINRINSQINYKSDDLKYYSNKKESGYLLEHLDVLDIPFEYLADYDPISIFVYLDINYGKKTKNK